jgi:hypothetical protein
MSCIIGMKNFVNKEDENTLLNPSGWLNDQYLGMTMQILFF